MADYAEFRMVVSPDLANPGSWAVTVEKAPVAALAGPAGTVVSTLTRAQLNTLRSRAGWPNPAVLKQIGTTVRQSIFTEKAAAAFEASLQSAAQQQRGLRFVLVLQGQENDVVGANQVRLSEVPIEVLYDDDNNQFFATDVATPISRSGQWQPDRPPQRVVLPLRVLVAIASPTDKPPAQMAQEVAAIRDVVEPLTTKGVLEVDFIEQATRSSVAAQLNDRPYHVLHFIGHGGFDVVGDVDAPRAHLCFVRPNGQSDPTDADTFTVMLKNSSVRLLVITACSSAAPTPPVPGDPIDSGPLGTSAFEGVAQRAVAGVSGVTAAVAMQFDLEDVGAVEFSRAFYANLTEPGLALDEIVTRARKALVLHLQAGHRAWVTPAVYWRCEGGKVFEIEPLVQPLNGATLQQLQGVNLQLATYREAVEKIHSQPPELREALDGLRLGWITEMQRLLAQRSELLGDSIEIQGVRAPAGQEVACRLSLRVRTTATIDLIHFRLEVPGDISFVGSAVGADTVLPPAVAQLGNGVLFAVLVRPSDGNPWPPREYELGFFRFSVPPTAAAKVIDIRLTAAHVAREVRSPLVVTPADGMLFVD